MRHLRAVLLLLAYATLSFSAGQDRPSVFQIFDVVVNTDFDEAAIATIDSLEVPFPKGSSFQMGDLPTTKGNSTLIKMLCAHWGPTSEGTRLVHDLLILKTDGKQVLDAYLYTMEWQDQVSARLARMTAKDIPLKPEIRLAALGMRRVDGEMVGGGELLDNVYEGKKIF